MLHFSPFIGSPCIQITCMLHVFAFMDSLDFVHRQSLRRDFIYNKTIKQTSTINRDRDSNLLSFSLWPQFSKKILETNKTITWALSAAAWDFCWTFVMSIKTRSAFRSFSTNILSALSADLTAPSAFESAPLRQESPPHLPQPAPPHSSSHACPALVVPSQTCHKLSQKCFNAKMRVSFTRRAQIWIGDVWLAMPRIGRNKKSHILRLSVSLH